MLTAYVSYKALATPPFLSWLQQQLKSGLLDLCGRSSEQNSPELGIQLRASRPSQICQHSIGSAHRVWPADVLAASQARAPHRASNAVPAPPRHRCRGPAPAARGSRTTTKLRAAAAPPDEIARRRNFAIISHPDAGKTTLTEKLLLYGDAIQQAGMVKGASERPRLDVGLSGHGEGARHQYFVHLFNFRVWRRAHQPDGHAGPRGLFRGHVPDR